MVKRSGAAGLMFVGSKIATAVFRCREESSGADERGRESVGVWLVGEEREREEKKEKEEEDKKEKEKLNEKS